MKYVLANLAGIVCVALALFSTEQVGAAQVPATGATEIQLTSFGTLTDDLGLTINLTGNFEFVEIRALPSPLVYFDISGFDAALERIYHDNTGLEFEVGNDLVAFENFVVDAGAGTVFADLTAPGESQAGAAVFDIVGCAPDGCIGLDGSFTVSGLGLNLSATAAGVLSNVFGLDDLTGTAIGVANSTVLVPEPAALGLLVLSLAALARRRQGSR